jgi:RNA polymerase sigma-70 factor (ECF subfamily)
MRARSRSNAGPAAGVPANPWAWLVGVARHKALDRIRREARRPEKEAAAAGLHPAAPSPDRTRFLARRESRWVTTS